MSGLIRGLGGSEPYAAVAKPPGCRVVVLDGALADLAAGTDAIGRSYSYRIAPEGRDHADPLAIAFQAAAGPEALLPLAPVGLRARREAGGVRLRWIRRTRFGGDNWDLAEVPLNEDREAYAVEILAGAEVRRSFTASAPELLYDSAAEAADFGGPQASLAVRVAQLSTAVGRGRPASAALRIG